MTQTQQQYDPRQLPPLNTSADGRLTEQQVIAGFHSILQDSLAEARGEGLVTDDEIETGDVDIQIAGPSLALFFSALGAQGDPPSISAPDGSFALTTDNCPPSFEAFFRLWQGTVKGVKRLRSEERYDLALMLCDKEPSSSHIQLEVVRLAGDLKAVAIEITQRRTFQARYAADLQAALDSAVRPRPSNESSRPSMDEVTQAGHETAPSTRPVQYQPPPRYATLDGLRDGVDKVPVASLGVPTRTSTVPSQPRPPLSPTTTEHVENLSVIRETLYSALGDVIVTTPSLLSLTARGPAWASRAFFASTSLAILEVALTRVSPEGVHAVHLGRTSPRVIGPRETPAYLRPFLAKLGKVARTAKEVAEEDDQRAMEDAAEGREGRGSRLEWLRARLAAGADEGGGGEGGMSEGGGREEGDERVRLLANSINELALGMVNLPAFMERQAEAWSVLSGLSSL